MTSWTPDLVQRHLATLSLPERNEWLRLVQALPSKYSGLMDFAPSLGRDRTAPLHLAPFVVELERAWREAIRVTCHAPPRHGKTETLLAFIVLTLLLFPQLTLAYVTYEANVAHGKSRRAREWARYAGLRIPGVDRADEWRTAEGGGLLATGIGGPLTGQGVNILLVDDPYKNRVQAESSAWRRTVDDWMDDVGRTRIEPGGSIVVNHTRWHTDDLIGGLTSSRWKHIKLPAVSTVDGDERALWPERYSLKAFEELRESEYTWASLYQGEPRPRGAQLFYGVNQYEKLPDKYSIAIGVDGAYTAKTSADWSIAVVLFEHDGWWYVVDVIRKQVRIDDFADVLLGLAKTYGRAPMLWYGSVQEVGAADLLRKLGVPIAGIRAAEDKFIRAQPVATAWKRGRVLLPKSAPWLNDFVRVLTNFTGVNDPEDDDVDALAAAFDLLPAKPILKEPSRDSPEWAAREEQRMFDARAKQVKSAQNRRPWERR